MLRKINDKGCIYEIYKWMGAVGKYSGAYPLPGVYEKKEWSALTKGIINYVIPGLNCALLLTIFTWYCSGYSFDKSNDLTDILLVICDASIFTHFFSCIFFNHLSLRRNIVSHLKSHLSIDDLLRSKTQKLKRFVGIFFVLMMIYTTAHRGCINTGHEIKFSFKLVSEDPSQMVINFCILLLVCYNTSLAMCVNPHVMYIVFHRILKCAYDELLERIRKNKHEKLSRDLRVKKIRKYMKFYCELCKLSSQLDRMVSPLLLIRFIQHYMGEIHSITLIMYKSFSVFSLTTAAAILSGGVVLIVVSNVAYITKKSQLEVLPAIYSAFKADEIAVKTELQNFALQSMYFTKPFSVSGFLKLDRQLIVSIFQSLLSQVIVFYRVRTGNGNKSLITL